jgi:hypothetical protein
MGSGFRLAGQPQEPIALNTGRGTARLFAQALGLSQQALIQGN